jgi:hypothetical protein
VSTLLFVRKAALTALAALALSVAVAQPAGAEGGQYEAKYIGQSRNLTLESGETGNSWFDAQNIGSEAWTRDIARLGTTNPRDRISAFSNGTWVIPGARATSLDQPFVQPGGIGRFSFTVTAPSVSATTAFNEYFAPVAEGRAWMENDANGWAPNAIFITYTVVPAAPPTVRITSSPASVPAGTPVTVQAAATDNRRVAGVQFQIAGRPPVTDNSAPYEATLPSSGLAPGPQRIDVTAVDGSGRTATATTTVNLDPVANGGGATRDVKMTAGFGKRRSRPRVTIPYGKATFVRGRLTSSSGQPITGAVISVATQVLTGDRGYREQRPISTGQDGGFAYRAPRGPSRRIRLSYTPFAVDAQPSVVKLVRMKSRAGMRFTASRRSVRRGHRVILRGRLKGGHIPNRGVIVVLEGFQRGFGWRSFDTVRSRHGRFKATYRPQRAAAGTVLHFRAVVREQAGYPWATGRSRSVRVRVR